MFLLIGIQIHGIMQLSGMQLSGMRLSGLTCIILNGSQLDAGYLIQAKRNEKALRRIQKKMMCLGSTLDWSQSNNISCCH